MFGRRKVPFGSGPASPPPPPPPPSGKEPFPIEKMDAALVAVIRLFTRTLDEAGVDAGGLTMRGDVPANVAQLLAGCITYRGEDDGGPTYLALGLTKDFKAMMYPPHCRLYLIINSAGICEDPLTQSFLSKLAPEQLPGPLVDAHLMRRWIRYILPTGQAMTQGSKALETLHQQMMEDLMAALRQVPLDMRTKLDSEAKFMEWSDGFPAVVGRPLTPDVERMNGLPVTPFIGETLTRFLADLQARGIQQERAA